jgi:hypothetical protein
MNGTPAEDARGVGDHLRKETAVNAGRATKKERESKERSSRCVFSPRTRWCVRGRRKVTVAAGNDAGAWRLEEDVDDRVVDGEHV